MNLKNVGIGAALVFALGLSGLGVYSGLSGQGTNIYPAVPQPWHPGIAQNARTTVAQPARTSLHAVTDGGTAVATRVGACMLKGGQAYQVSVVSAAGTSPTATWTAMCQVVACNVVSDAGVVHDGGTIPATYGEPILPGGTGSRFTLPGTASTLYDLYCAASTDAAGNLSVVTVSGQEP